MRGLLAVIAIAGLVGAARADEPKAVTGDPPPAVAGAEAASEAAVESEARVATRRMMRDLVAGRMAWAIDPARGVHYLGYLASESDEDPAWSRRMCDGEARWFLRKHREMLGQWITTDERFRCSNRGGARCELGVIGEFGVIWDFQFRLEGGRLVLDAIEATDAAYPPADQAKVLAWLRGQRPSAGCAP